MTKDELMENKPMTVGELIDYLGVYDEKRIVVVQDSATHYSSVSPIIIRDSIMRKTAHDQYIVSEDGTGYFTLIIG